MRKSNYVRVPTTVGRGTSRTAVMDDKGGARKKSKVVVRFKLKINEAVLAIHLRNQDEVGYTE